MAIKTMPIRMAPTCLEPVYCFAGSNVEKIASTKMKVKTNSIPKAWPDAVPLYADEMEVEIRMQKNKQINKIIKYEISVQKFSRA